jgi:hypothetical protein
MNDDVHVVLLNLPTDMRGFLVANADGSNTVVLNARYSWEQNRLTYLHELRHIQGGDLYADEDADNLEEKRHE